MMKHPPVHVCYFVVAKSTVDVQHDLHDGSTRLAATSLTTGPDTLDVGPER